MIFEKNKALERIRKNQTYIPSHIVNELKVLSNKIEDISIKREQHIAIDLSQKTYSERIEFIKRDISLLREKAELSEKILKILEDYK